MLRKMEVGEMLRLLEGPEIDKATARVKGTPCQKPGPGKPAISTVDFPWLACYKSLVTTNGYQRRCDVRR